jgi:hypothetical protein
VKLKPVSRDAGWVGDFDPIGEWNPILKANDPAAESLKYPCWFPDEYAAWMWRSYHSAQPDIKLTGPVVEYAKFNDKWGGPQCGLGYGGYLSANDPQRFTATAMGDYDQVEFRSGDQLLGTAKAQPWEVEGVKLTPGLHALFAVGVRKTGERVASRPAFVIVR